MLVQSANRILLLSTLPDLGPMSEKRLGAYPWIVGFVGFYRDSALKSKGEPNFALHLNQS